MVVQWLSAPGSKNKKKVVKGIHQLITLINQNGGESGSYCLVILREEYQYTIDNSDYQIWITEVGYC